MTRNTRLLIGGILTLGMVPVLYARSRPKPESYSREIIARRVALAEAEDAGSTYEEREAA